MRLPPFKIDGRNGALRWTDARGVRRGSAGRVAYLMRRVGENVIAGTGEDFEMRVMGGKRWWRVELTPDEARSLFTGLAGPGIVARAEATRRRRIAAGKRVVG